MHRVLFIREILLDIFGHCSPSEPLDNSCHKADLAALVRTCRTFKEPALDILWEILFDLSALVRCLPAVCRFDQGCYSFSRPLSEAEWNTLRGYTRRVKSIRQFQLAFRRRILLPQMPFTDPLFPNLRALFWGFFRTIPAEYIIVPSLTSLCLDFRIPPEHLPMEFLETIGERCPNIRQFRVFFAQTGPMDAAISRQLGRWTSLQYVGCRGVTLSIDVILHLPSLSTLKWLLFQLSANLGNRITRLDSPFVFSNLAHLDVESTSLEAITTLFSRVRLPKIEDLSVTIYPEYTPKRAVQKYWSAIQSACPSNTLARLVFSSISDNRIEDFDEEEQRRPHLSLDDLPYKDFGNLRKIGIDTLWSVHLADDDLLDLVSTSPQLEELYINNYLGWDMDEEGGITLSALVQLLRQCPSLHTASLEIDTRTFTRIPHGLDVSFPPRKTILGMLSLNCLDSYFIPELEPDYESVFKTLKLYVWSSFGPLYGSFDEESQDGEDE